MPKPVATAAPIPNATARDPTRPMYRAQPAVAERPWPGESVSIVASSCWRPGKGKDAPPLSRIQQKLTRLSINADQGAPYALKCRLPIVEYARIWKGTATANLGFADRAALTGVASESEGAKRRQAVGLVTPP